MVKQITAFRAEDGTIFDTEFDATEHDCKTRLQKCVGETVTVEIMSKLLGVYEIIGPFAELLRQVPPQTEAVR